MKETPRPRQSKNTVHKSHYSASAPSVSSSPAVSELYFVRYSNTLKGRYYPDLFSLFRGGWVWKVPDSSLSSGFFKRLARTLALGGPLVFGAGCSVVISMDLPWLGNDIPWADVFHGKLRLAITTHVSLAVCLALTIHLAVTIGFALAFPFGLTNRFTCGRN